MHTTVQDPYAAPADRLGYTSGWFDTSMPDLNTRQPQLANYLIQNALWWIEYASLSGIRVDTYSYSDRDFMAVFSGRIMREYPNFNIVGEEWNNDPSIVAYWQRGKANSDGYVSNLPSLMDFPLESTLLDALLEPEANNGFRKLYERLSTDFVYANPGNLVVFADNHDIDRLYTRLKRDPALFRMALVAVATLRGIPQLYYGTEVLLANTRLNDDGDKRQDFPGGWSGDKANGFSGEGLTAEQRDAQAFVRTLFTWRRGAAAVHSGRLRHYTPEKNSYVYFRQLGTQTVMVVLNKSGAPVTLDLERFREQVPRGSRALNVLANSEQVLDQALTVAPRSATILDLRVPANP
jgi:glycosidase